MNEDQRIEFKASWHDNYLKWLCGFANAQGGVLEVGRNDNGKVVGLKNASQLMEELPNKIRDLLGVVADINLLEEDNKQYLRITVEPYSVPISYRGEYHYRSGSTKQILKGTALDHFLLNKTGRSWDTVPVPGIGIDDLDAETLNKFREQATNSKRLNASVLTEGDSGLIEKLRLMENRYLKRAAVLLFHPDPERCFTGAAIKIGYFEGKSDLRFQDEVCGNLFAQVSKTMDLLLTKYLKAIISYKGILRVETYPVPESALREAVLNAVIHRDYAVAAPIQVRVYADRLSISNPGRLPEDWSLSVLLGQHPTRPFNPDIANTFFRSGEIESWGRGIQHIFDACQQTGTPDPIFKIDSGEFLVEFPFSETYLGGVVIYDQTRENLQRTVQETVQETIQETIQEKILALLRKYPNITQKSLAERIGISPSGVRYHIDNLRNAGHIQHVGSTKKGHWEVKADDNE